MSTVAPAHQLTKQKQPRQNGRRVRAQAGPRHQDLRRVPRGRALDPRLLLRRRGLPREAEELLGAARCDLCATATAVDLDLRGPASVFLLTSAVPLPADHFPDAFAGSNLRIRDTLNNLILHVRRPPAPAFRGQRRAPADSLTRAAAPCCADAHRLADHRRAPVRADRGHGARRPRAARAPPANCTTSLPGPTQHSPPRRACAQVVQWDVSTSPLYPAKHTSTHTHIYTQSTLQVGKRGIVNTGIASQKYMPEKERKRPRPKWKQPPIIGGSAAVNKMMNRVMGKVMTLAAARRKMSEIPKEVMRKRDKGFYKRHKTSINQRQRLYRQTEHFKKARRQKLRDDVLATIHQRIRRRLHTTLSSRKDTKKCRTMELVGCSREELHKHLQDQLPDGCSLLECDIDHIFPLAMYNLSTIDGQKRAQHYTNLQPLLPTINKSKRSKPPLQNMARKVVSWAWPDNIKLSDLPITY